VLAAAVLLVVAVVAAAVFVVHVARKAVGDLKDEWARKTMLPEHCDVVAAVSAVVLAAAVVVVSEDMVDDVGSSAIAPPGVQPDPREAPRGLPHRDNYCFGYCSSCLDAVTCDNLLGPSPLPVWGPLLDLWGLPRVLRGPLLLQREPPLNPAYPDAPGAVMASYPNEAFYRT